MLCLSAVTLAERTFQDPGQTLRLLADPTRLRILALLEREELAVGELSKALGMTQSRVSNHLRLLREADLLSERHAGASTYLRLAPLGESEDLAARIWRELRDGLDGVPEHEADLVRLAALLGQRGGDRAFFDRLAGTWDKVAVGFSTGQARERVASRLLPSDLVVADLGCGTGYLAQALLGAAGRVLCVDASSGMLDEAKERLTRAPRGTEIELRCGELDALPIADGEVDGVVAGLVLHHLSGVDGALAEMRCILKPGGRAVVLELNPHREEWMRAELGDRHLGLEPSDVLEAMRRAGFDDVTLDPVDDRYRPERPDEHGGGKADLELYLVRGIRPRLRMSSNPRTR